MIHPAGISPSLMTTNHHQGSFDYPFTTQPQSHHSEISRSASTTAPNSRNASSGNLFAMNNGNLANGNGIDGDYGVGLSQSQDEPTPSPFVSNIDTVSRPDRECLPNTDGLSLIILGIADDGAKSRVETQVKVTLVLVKPRQDISNDKNINKSAEVQQGQRDTSTSASHGNINSSSMEGVATVPNDAQPTVHECRTPEGGVTADISQKLERIGSYSHVKLPTFSALKRRSRKHIKTGMYRNKSRERGGTIYICAAISLPPSDSLWLYQSSASLRSFVSFALPNWQRHTLFFPLGMRFALARVAHGHFFYFVHCM